MFAPLQPKKTITIRLEMFSLLIIKGRSHIIEIAGEEPGKLLIPLQQDYCKWGLQNSLALQTAIEGYTGKLSIHYPSYQMFTFWKNTGLESIPKLSQLPVKGPTAFTDGGGKSGKAGVVWREGNEWKTHVVHCEGSVQKVELQAVTEAPPNVSVNIICNSLYVVGVVQQMETAILKHCKQEGLYQQFTCTCTC